MSKTLAEFNCLVDAEDYLKFFELAYDPTFVNVNRLHILQKFSALMKEIDASAAEVSEAEKLEQYKSALQQAYDLFLSSTPQEQKTFKVFKEKPKNVVTIGDIGIQ